LGDGHQDCRCEVSPLKRNGRQTGDSTKSHTRPENGESSGQQPDRNNATVNVVTRRWREHFPTPPSPPRFATPSRAADLFPPLFCGWLSFY